MGQDKLNNYRRNNKITVQFRYKHMVVSLNPINYFCMAFRFDSLTFTNKEICEECRKNSFSSILGNLSITTDYYYFNILFRESTRLHHTTQSAQFCIRYL